jgi:site-specific recombinase XerD
MTTDLKATRENLAIAKAEMEAHRQEVRGRRSRLPEVVGFHEAADRFLEWSRIEHREHPNTWRRHASSLSFLKVFMGNTALHRIKAGDIEEFKNTRRELGMAEVTIRKDLMALSQVFQFAMKHGWCDSNPVRDVKLPSALDSFNERTITLEEEVLYFAEAGKQNWALHDVGRLMLWQGMRPAEVLALTKDDVDLEGKLLTIVRGKSRASRRKLHITPESAAILRCRIAAPHEHLFPGGRRGYNGRPLGYSVLWRAHIAVLDALNLNETRIEPFDIYSLRHTFATRFYESTKDLDKLARILGHSDLSTVRRYVNPSQDDLREAMKIHEAACKRRAAGSEPSEDGARDAAETETIH